MIKESGITIHEYNYQKTQKKHFSIIVSNWYLKQTIIGKQSSDVVALLNVNFAIIYRDTISIQSYWTV